jgi:formylglycine-generating enzyme required for sulfatase activity
MNKSMKQNRFLILLVSVCISLVGGIAFAKTSPELVKQEEGFYYGYGKGATADEASLEAKRDLVSSALTATLRAVDAKASRVNVSDESVKARLGDLKPYVEAKKGSSPAVTYRIKIADWDKKEKAYADTLRAGLAARVNALSGKLNLSDKINGSLAILAALADNGETELLTDQPSGTELLSRKVEAICAEASKTLVLAVSVKDGFINPTSRFSVKAADSSGNPVANLSLTVTWETPSFPTDAAVESAPLVNTMVKTDSRGNVNIDYPASDDYRNRPVTLTVSTAFAGSVPSSVALKKLDAANAVDARYVHFDNVKNAFASVTVPAGKFNAGAVAQDTRAGKKEAARVVTTDSYAVDVGLVTNARYAAFLHATRAESVPEYFDNSDYNQGNQPVVGVSVKDAEAYAEWLSAQTGCKYRLPTEEEWEKAARAGEETIYPWGDDNPADGKKANYKDNGSFAVPSPVGAFGSGKNAWGLVDMAGNVWEWTSSTHSKDTASTLRIVKGGSWMDGPTELRISNFREIDGLMGYPDVGFRLVKEESK